MEGAECAWSVWSDLVEGRSEVVDRFDGDGRRFLVVRTLGAQDRARPSLSARDRVIILAACRGRSNKAIAYEVGVGESTVSKLLRAAAGRLGAVSISDLVRWPWAV